MLMFEQKFCKGYMGLTFPEHTQSGWPITTHWCSRPIFLETGTKQSVTDRLGNKVLQQCEICEKNYVCNMQTW